MFVSNRMFLWIIYYEKQNNEFNNMFWIKIYICIWIFKYLVKVFYERVSEILFFRLLRNWK